MLKLDRTESAIMEKCGAFAMITYTHIRDWVKSNARHNKTKNFKHGKYWMFESIEEMAKAIPSATVSKIRTALNKLRKFGFIISGCFNSWACDRTTWYTVSDENVYIEEMRNKQDESANDNQIKSDYSASNTNVNTKQTKNNSNSAVAPVKKGNVFGKAVKSTVKTLIERTVSEDEFADADDEMFKRLGLKASV